MTKLIKYSHKGAKNGEITLPKEWQTKLSNMLLAQAIFVYEDRQHPGLSKSKSRGFINKTTKKIYKQKGTGNARHGAKSAPIFVGGGTAHGPKGLKRVLYLSKTLRSRAREAAIAYKINAEKVFLVDGIENFKKTSEVQTFANSFAKDRGLDLKRTRMLFALSDKNANHYKAIKNLDNVEVTAYNHLNAYNIYKSGVLLVDSEALDGVKETTKKEVVKKVTVKKEVKKVSTKKAVKKEAK